MPASYPAWAGASLGSTSNMHSNLPRAVSRQMCLPARLTFYQHHQSLGTAADCQARAKLRLHACSTRLAPHVVHCSSRSRSRHLTVAQANAARPAAASITSSKNRSTATHVRLLAAHQPGPVHTHGPANETAVDSAPLHEPAPAPVVSTTQLGVALCTLSSAASLALLRALAGNNALAADPQWTSVSTATLSSVASELHLPLAHLVPPGQPLMVPFSRISLPLIGSPVLAAELAFPDVYQLLHLPHFSALGMLRYLIHYPILVLALAVLLYFAIPRLIKAGVRYVVVPVAVLGGVYLAVNNPSSALGLAQAAWHGITAHPVVFSVAILIALALALSPYILVGVALLVLFSGVQLLPAPLRPLLPSPIIEAERQISRAQSALRLPGRPAPELQSAPSTSSTSLVDRLSLPFRERLGAQRQVPGKPQLRQDSSSTSPEANPSVDPGRRGIGARVLRRVDQISKEVRRVAEQRFPLPNSEGRNGTPGSSSSSSSSSRSGQSGNPSIGSRETTANEPPSSRGRSFDTTRSSIDPVGEAADSLSDSSSNTGSFTRNQGSLSDGRTAGSKTAQTGSSAAIPPASALNTRFSSLRTRVGGAIKQGQESAAPVLQSGPAKTRQRASELTATVKADAIPVFQEGLTKSRQQASEWIGSIKANAVPALQDGIVKSQQGLGKLTAVVKTKTVPALQAGLARSQEGLQSWRNSLAKAAVEQRSKEP